MRQINYKTNNSFFVVAAICIIILQFANIAFHFNKKIALPPANNTPVIKEIVKTFIDNCYGRYHAYTPLDKPGGIDFQCYEEKHQTRQRIAANKPSAGVSKNDQKRVSK